MTLSVEEFGKRLIKNISDHPDSRGGYILGSNLISAIQLALDPGGEQGREFPRMLYKPGPAGDQEQTSIVNDDEELHAALEQGWRREPAPVAPGYPQNWVEVDPSRGTDYRRVLIRNQAEEKLFKANTNPADWTKDSAHALAGRPTSLDDLVEEHRQQLHRELDQKLRNPPSGESS